MTNKDYIVNCYIDEKNEKKPLKKIKDINNWKAKIESKALSEFYNTKITIKNNQE